LAFTLLFEQELLNPEIEPYLEKYLMLKPGISAERVYHLFCFVSDILCSSMCGLAQYAGVHGGGSAVMKRIGIKSQHDLESKKDLVKCLSGRKN